MTSSFGEGPNVLWDYYNDNIIIHIRLAFRGWEESLPAHRPRHQKVKGEAGVRF